MIIGVPSQTSSYLEITTCLYLFSPGHQGLSVSLLSSELKVSYSGDRGGIRIAAGDTLGATTPRHYTPSPL